MGNGADVNIVGEQGKLTRVRSFERTVGKKLEFEIFIYDFNRTIVPAHRAGIGISG